MKVDVLVVGAGPAGSCAVRELAEGGVDVLAIDRRTEIGYPVECGEFLPTEDELKRILPASEEYGDLFSIDKDSVERSTSIIELHGPRGLRYDMEFDGITLDRRRFDKNLWHQAERAGAKVMLGTELLGLSDRHIAKTSSGEIGYRFIIGADGPLSRVRKSVRLPEPKYLSQAITAQAKGDYGGNVRMYFGGVAPGGYAWIIPKRGMANVGLGVQKRFTDEPISQTMRRFIDEFKFATEETTYGQVPVSGPVKKTVAGNALIVGDAAGQVMATNGGGIPIAMICGRIAGRSAVAAIKGGGGLEGYEKEWRRQVAKPLGNAARTKAMADLFFGSDGRLKFAMKMLGRRGLERAILCKRLFYLF